MVEGIGGYKGTVEIPFAIVKGETETKGALTAGKNSYTYGEVVKLTFTAEPKKETGAAYRAGADKADFYCGNTLLGSADVVNGKAVLLYDTAEQKIPAGSVDITVDFGGNSQLEAARFTQSGVFALNKRVLERSDISSVSLQDFVYEPNKKTTAITGIHWADTRFRGCPLRERHRFQVMLRELTVRQRSKGSRLPENGANGMMTRSFGKTEISIRRR